MALIKLLLRRSFTVNGRKFGSSSNTRTMARTINLAEPSECARPRQVQKLVSAEVPPLCPHKKKISHGYQPIRVVPVRICRREDLEIACRDIKFCDCPQKLPPKTTKDILCAAMVFGGKSIVAAGFVYWTVAEGLWGQPEVTERIYVNIRGAVAEDPYLGEISLPRMEYIKFKVVDSYNRLILTFMGTLVGVPLKMSRQIRDILYPCEPIEDEKDKKKKKA